MIKYINIPYDQWDSGAPKEVWQSVEVPDVELIMERPSKHYPDEIGFKQDGHYCYY